MRCNCLTALYHRGAAPQANHTPFGITFDNVRYTCPSRYTNASSSNHPTSDSCAAVAQSRIITARREARFTGHHLTQGLAVTTGWAAPYILLDGRRAPEQMRLW